MIVIIFKKIFFISWRLITLQYCSGFCHTLKWISHGFTSIPHPDLPSHLPLHSIPLGLPSAPGPSTCLMHPTWADDLLVQPLWKTVWRFLKKTENRTAIWPSNPTSWHTHQGNQIWKRHVHPKVHHSTVYHSQDMEAT